ncbi:hypothetical protein [Nitrincola alkalisediminis]|uniref:hypothetical protein n=1 Tax=Nitrincola alkalisediminis TaxID=1366656 RepID=UPI001873DC23|nr:hypothetical protein [Nitrincola alkalisediminis]
MSKQRAFVWIAGIAMLLAAQQVTADVQRFLPQPPILIIENILSKQISSAPVDLPSDVQRLYQEEYEESKVYEGYFDAKKCYIYADGMDESDTYFYPDFHSRSHLCPGPFWSGNFLNWATTSSLDPFRKTLTGGLRVKDTPTETWLESARLDRETFYQVLRFPNEGISPERVNNATPFSVNWIGLRSQGNQLRLRLLSEDLVQPTTSPLIMSEPYSLDKTYELLVRVAVCVNGLREDNCKAYGNYAKPEGLIQGFSQSMRFTVLGYLNDLFLADEGCVMRAPLKFVGPKRLSADGEWEDNPSKEWSETTGVLIRNPDKEEAIQTNRIAGLRGDYAIIDSGVINYINKFGHMPSKNHKGADPASELFHQSLAYLRKLAPIDQYLAVRGTQLDNYQLVDGFPVMNWISDPLINLNTWCKP